MKQQHSRQQQIPGNLAKQILMVTLNKSEFQRLVVSHYTIIPRTHRSRKTIIGREDYQLTIIWARRLSGDNYLSGGLSLEIPRGISQLWLFFPSSYFWTIENCNSPAPTMSLFNIKTHCVTGAVLTHDVMYPEDFFWKPPTSALYTNVG